MSPSFLTNEIKSERANCMCEGSWEALWSQWWRSDVVILFRSMNTNVFHGLHLCRLWFTRSQRVVFELLALITATSPDSLKIRAVFKIVEDKLNNCPQANMNHPCLPLTSLLNSRYRVFPCEKCQNELASPCRNTPDMAQLTDHSFRSFLIHQNVHEEFHRAEMRNTF